MFRFGSSVFLIVFYILTLPSCRDMEKKKLARGDPEVIYFDYMVWGDEASGIVTVRLQYRRGGKDGDSFLLEDPAKAEFDGEMISPDSAGFNGAYYEAVRWANEFDGSHNIVFTDPDENQYKTAFDFPVISLKTELPTLIHRDDLFFELDGVSPKDRIRVLITDTSFYGKGVERVDTVEDGRVFIPAEELAVLKNGPIYLEIFREEERYLDNGAKRTGNLSLSYALKRELELQDSVKKNRPAP